MGSTSKIYNQQLPRINHSYTKHIKSVCAFPFPPMNSHATLNTTIATNKNDPTNMTQPWNTIFNMGRHDLKWLPFPAAAAEKAPFLEAFHGNTLAEGAVRCQGTLVVHCGSSNFTTDLWNALGFIQKHLATVSFNPTELFVDGGGYLLGIYWRVWQSFVELLTLHISFSMTSNHCRSWFKIEKCTSTQYTFDMIET